MKAKAGRLRVGMRAQGTFKTLLVLGLILVTAVILLLIALKFSGMYETSHQTLTQVVR